MTEALFQWWRSMGTRERRLVLLAAAVLLIALVYQVLFEPAWKGRRAIAKELPTLRVQVAQMDALGIEARRLAAIPAGNQSPQAIRRVFEESAAAAGFGRQLTQITLSGEVLDVRFSDVGFASWLGWFESALRETRLRVIDVSIQREATPGQASIRLALEAPRRDGR